eukprot:m.9293 g.9293  ORF g.9293 m.9293 type:complete len:106 (+) comp4039_c0_seq1:1466-1783(+)
MLTCIQHTLDATPEMAEGIITILQLPKAQIYLDTPFKTWRYNIINLPDRVAIAKARCRFPVAEKKGIAMVSPSGILCTATAVATSIPSFSEERDVAATANPSGKL